MTKSAPGSRVIVHEDECKGCALCVESCPVHGLSMSRTRLNRIGYHPVEFTDGGCTGCGVCYYACPEPGALRVIRHRPAGSVPTEGSVKLSPPGGPTSATAAPVAAAKGGETACSS
jgi:ferredoxin